MGRKISLKTEFKTVYVPLPESMKEARRAGLLLLLQWIDEDWQAEETYEEKNRLRPL